MKKAYFVVLLALICLANTGCYVGLQTSYRTGYGYYYHGRPVGGQCYSQRGYNNRTPYYRPEYNYSHYLNGWSTNPYDYVGVQFDRNGHPYQPPCNKGRR